MSRLLAVSTMLIRDEEGTSTAEYGLVLGLIAVVCIAVVTVVGTKTSSLFKSLATTIWPGQAARPSALSLHRPGSGQ